MTQLPQELRRRAALMWSVVVCALLAACGPSQEELARQAHARQFEAAIRSHYGSSITAGTFGVWKVSSVAIGPPNRFSDRITTVIVGLTPPPRIADDLMARAPEAQFRAVGLNACPPRNHALWTGTSGNDVLMLEVTNAGRVFIDVDCRRYGP